MGKPKEKRKRSRSERPTVTARTVIFDDSPTPKRSVTHIPIPFDSTLPQPPCPSTSAAVETLVDPPQDDPEPAPPQTRSAYSKQKSATLESWNKVRDSLFETSVEMASPISYTCTICGMEEECLIFRCRECGPAAMFCIECLRSQHAEVNSFHVPEKWEGTYFRPYQLHHTMQLPHHASCQTWPYRKSLRVFDQAGRLQHIEVTLCSCEPPSCTLLRYGLWASTVSDPQTAISTSLLEWLVMSTLEAQVSVEAFCRIVRYQSHLSYSEGKTLYKALIGQPISEFRHLQYRLRTMKDLCPSLDNGTACPACSKAEGTQIISLDGNFGLVRKKSSGTSSAPPLHGTSVFLDDDVVQAFMATYGDASKPDEDCSNFKAGNSLRSQAKQRKLDIQGVFGSVCRHEVPRRFLNMTHGERLGYPVCIIQQLLADVEGSKNVQLKIIYDISCVLVAHLKKKKKEEPGAQMLAQIDVALDVFHAYGHKTACQLQYSTRRRAGFGLTDGEAVERMWAFLRKFARTTKEMTPSHRTDLLTDALIHYTMRKTLDIEVALVAKLQNAKKVHSVADEGLKAVINEANVSIDDIQTWSEREKEAISMEKVPTSTSTAPKWKRDYVKKLLQLKAARQRIPASEDDSDADVYRSSYIKLDDQVRSLEAQHKVKKRWASSSKEFETVMREVDEAERPTLLSRMRGLAYERSFLIARKKRYPEGQQMAMKLSEQLKTAGTKLRKTIASYNALEWEPTNQDFPTSVEFREATDPTWQRYSCLEPTFLEETGLPHSVMRQAIEHLNLLQRAGEEAEMVQKEMKEVFHHFQNQRDLTELAVAQLDVDEDGKRAALTTHIVSLDKRIESMYYFFQHHVPDLDLPFVPSSYLTLFPIPENVDLEMCEPPSDEERMSDCESDDEDNVDE
ncbi:Hypp5105 [Branchiostoma lanceolatum]|uniref:Hypp5105 protein n=1 Tax=Branchiostoma lanceolatum TaxID=7740 RepID=A0A8K0AD64_BRALA|nr:Hypp5105 [Branchiostoma lanceolatum]